MSKQTINDAKGYMMPPSRLRTRDSQRSRVYRAERMLWKNMPLFAHLQDEDHPWATTETRSELTHRVKWVLDRIHPQLVDRLSTLVVKQTTGHRAYAVPRIKTIVVGRCCALWIVVHELAHIVTPEGHAHNEWFAYFYAEMVRQCFGETVYAELRRCYAACGVKCASDEVALKPEIVLIAEMEAAAKSGLVPYVVIEG